MHEQKYLSKKKSFNRLLLNWWKENKRNFPWRQTTDPYSILIAEMLLRKTTSKQVEKMYNLFLKKYPNIKKLSKADLEELIELLRPLGIEYHRADLFLKFGNAVIKNYNGIIPTDFKELQKLPGVGQYAANAVLNLTSDKKAPMVDTNFIRIVERIFNIKSLRPRARTDPQIWQIAGNLIPVRKSKDFNLAVLDFGALICKARNPKCDICPLYSLCSFRQTIN